MTDYTKQVNFAVKDGLSSGNANKAILGTEIDTEFNEIATAVATKADSASPTFTGTATAATLDVATFQIDGVEVTATPAELNILDGATVTTAELNYLDGVTSNVQTQLDAKQASGSYAATVHTHTKSDITDFSDGDYATAAQGSTADSAVQPNDSVTLGNLTVSQITIGPWTFSNNAGTLEFNNGSTRMSLSSTGALVVDDDITAFGTP